MKQTEGDIFNPHIIADKVKIWKTKGTHSCLWKCNQLRNSTFR